jgi:hypothetical protein
MVTFGSYTYAEQSKVNVPMSFGAAGFDISTSKTQETVLLLPRRRSGQEGVTEKQLRGIAREVDWTCQKKLFGSLMGQAR